MDLIERMLKMTFEHRIDCGQPVYWLLHSMDFKAIDDLTKREQEESRYHPGDGVYFRGIRCAENSLANPGEPLLAFGLHHSEIPPKQEG